MMNELMLNTDLTLATVLEQQLSLRHFIESSPRDECVMINLSQVKRSDSAGLALMIEALRLGCHLKKEIRFKAIPEQMVSMMNFCNVLPLFEKSV